MDTATKKEFENLGAMIKRGFDETASKQDLDVFRTDVNAHLEVVDKRLNNIELNTNHMSASLGAVQQDVAEIKKHFIYRYEFEDLMARVKYLETKLGVESGK